MTDIHSLPDIEAPMSKFDLSTLNGLLQSKEKVTNVLSELKMVIVAIILFIAAKFVPDTMVPFHWKVVIFGVLLFIIGKCKKEKKGE